MPTYALPRSAQLLLALLATPLLSKAQSSTQPVLSAIPFIGYDISASGPQIDASIIGVQDSVTTMSLACAPGTDASDCGLFPAQALIYGPSTYLMAMSDGTDFVGTQDCLLAGTTASATCMEFASGSGANFPGSSTTTYAPTDVQLVSVTVTAGAELLAAATASAGASVSSLSSSSSSSSSAAVTVLTGAPSSTATAATVGTTSTARTSTASVSVASASSTGAAVGQLTPAVGGVVGMVFGMLGYFAI